tara:strand:+ start:1474 stop:2862 length:1389 start_codon:yes stop_codon:yes gene_type:complete
VIDQTQEAHFSRYGKPFQEKIFQCFMTDRDWAAQMVEIMNPSFFDVNYLQYLSERFFSYYTKYKCFPTMGLLVTIIKDDLSQKDDAILRDQIVSYLHRIKTNPHVTDLNYVKDKTLDFCRKQAFKDALEESVELIQTEKFESVLTIMRKAVSVGLPSSTGHDFFEDAEARFVKINRQACPTGLTKLDAKDILRGGLGRGEIGVVTANTGVGKSHWLVAMGANAMRVGKNVLHYTFELTEHAVGLRYDANLCDVPANEVQDRKAEVMDKYKEMELGRLIIKEYPTGSASSITIRNHVEKLMLKGFTPSVIVIDYADIMRSTKSYDSLRHELKLIYEELRNLAMDLNIPIWTASQANRDSAKSDIVGLENMSEAYGKAMVADVVVSLSRKPTEKATGSGRLFVAKNRAGKDGIVFPLNIDTAKSTFKILDEDALTLDEAVKQSNSEMKQLLKQKWAEVNGTDEN